MPYAVSAACAACRAKKQYTFAIHANLLLHRDNILIERTIITFRAITHKGYRHYG